MMIRFITMNSFRYRMQIYEISLKYTNLLTNFFRLGQDNKVERHAPLRIPLRKKNEEQRLLFIFSLSYASMLA